MIYNLTDSNGEVIETLDCVLDTLLKIAVMYDVAHARMTMDIETFIECFNISEKIKKPINYGFWKYQYDTKQVQRLKPETYYDGLQEYEL